MNEPADRFLAEARAIALYLGFPIQDPSSHPMGAGLFAFRNGIGQDILALRNGTGIRFDWDGREYKLSMGIYLETRPDRWFLQVEDVYSIKKIIEVSGTQADRALLRDLNRTVTLDQAADLLAHLHELICRLFEDFLKQSGAQ